VGPLKGEDSVDEEYGAKFCLRTSICRRSNVPPGLGLMARKSISWTPHQHRGEVNLEKALVYLIISNMNPQ
jgi:hypothetical protein